MADALLKIFPVQTMVTSGFLKYSHNSFLYSLKVFEDRLVFSFFGIFPVFSIRRENVARVEKRESTWLSRGESGWISRRAKVWNPVYITYKKGPHTVERVISIFNTVKSEQFFSALQNWVR